LLDFQALLAEEKRRAQDSMAAGKAMPSADATPCVVWIGKERVNQLGGNWSFLSIGSLKAAMRPPAELLAAGFSHVVNAGAFAYDKGPLLYLDIPVVDSRETDLGQYFEESNRFIDSARAAHGQVLVHCRAGRSRSATLVCAYLIAKGGLQTEEALQLVRSARPIAQPNPSFLEQLQALENGYVQTLDALAVRDSWHPATSSMEDCRATGPLRSCSSLGQVYYRSRNGRACRGEIVPAQKASPWGSNIEIVDADAGLRFASVENWLRLISKREKEEVGEENGKACCPLPSPDTPRQGAQQLAEAIEDEDGEGEGEECSGCGEFV
jgi:hypothetical protein